MSGGEVLAEREGAVLRVTVNRPRKHNALSRSVLECIRRRFQEHASHPDLKVALLTGAGEKSFAAGGDLRDLSAVRTREEATHMAEQAKAALDAVRHFPLPVVAVLNGNAMGGGAELAVACDFRVAAAGARIGFVHGRLNISTAWGGGIDLMSLLGRNRALGVLCRSEMLDPREAMALGLVDAVAESGTALDVAVQDFIKPFLGQTPQVLRAFKAIARGVGDGTGRAALDSLETNHFAGTWIHDDHWAAADRVLAKSD